MVDLAGHLVALVGPGGLGDEVVRGARLIDASSELGLQLTFEVDGRRVHVELTPRDEGARHVAATARFTIAYRAAPGDLRAIPSERGRALCLALATRIGAREDAVLDTLAREVAAERESDDGGARVREVRGGRVLERAGTDGEPFLSLSPYAGCVIGCRFCYAQTRLATVRRLLRLPEVRWGSFVDARVDAPERLAAELHAAPPWPIKLCPIVSDPYQPVEAKLRLTARCLEVLRDRRHPGLVMVLTRSSLVRRDLAILSALASPRLGVSIPTGDDSVRAHFEPRAASIDERFETLALARDQGIPTFAVMQPMLPGDVTSLAARIAEVCSSVSLDRLRGTHGGAQDFEDPRYREAATDAWQVRRVAELRAALVERGVAVWEGELPERASETTPRSRNPASG